MLVVGMVPSQVGFWLLIALYAVPKSATTEPATGASVVRGMEHEVLGIEVKLEPTFPLMVEPGPVLVQVTVPEVAMGFVPSTV